MAERTLPFVRPLARAAWADYFTKAIGNATSAPNADVRSATETIAKALVSLEAAAIAPGVADGDRLVIVSKVFELRRMLRLDDVRRP